MLREELFTGKNQGNNRMAVFFDIYDNSWIAAQTSIKKDENGKPKFTIILIYSIHLMNLRK